MDNKGKRVRVVQKKEKYSAFKKEYVYILLVTLSAKMNKGNIRD